MTDLTRKLDVQATRAQRAEEKLSKAEQMLKAQEELSSGSAEHIMSLETEKAESRAELKKLHEQLEQALAAAAEATEALEEAEGRAEEASAAAENAAMERDAIRDELGNASVESDRASKGFDGEIRKLMEVRASCARKASSLPSVFSPLACICTGLSSLARSVTALSRALSFFYTLPFALRTAASQVPHRGA